MLIIPNNHVLDSETNNLYSSFENAVEFYKNGKYSEAIEIFDDFLSIKKNEIESFEKIKYIIFNFKKYNIAIQYFDKILETNPDDPEILGRKGLVLVMLYQREEALEAVNKALKIDPKNSISLLNKGILLYRMDKFNEAIEKFDKILDVNPKNIDASLGKGLSLEMLGKREESIKYFINAFQCNLNNHEDLSSISFNLVHFCFPINALTYANKILKTDPADPIGNKILDFITPEQNKLRQKIMELYQTYLHREPDITDLNYWEEKIFEGKSIPWIEEQMKNSEEGLNYYN